MPRTIRTTTQHTYPPEHFVASSRENSHTTLCVYGAECNYYIHNTRQPVALKNKQTYTQCTIVVNIKTPYIITRIKGTQHKGNRTQCNIQNKTHIYQHKYAQLRGRRNIYVHKYIVSQSASQAKQSASKSGASNNKRNT